MSYNFTKEELKQLAIEPSWLKRYSITTGKMVDNKKWKRVTGKSNKKIIIDEAEGSGIVYKDELTAMGKEK